MGGKLNQIYSAFTSSFGNFVMALANVWPSYTAELLASKDTPLSAPMTEAQISLLGSLPSLGAMLGTCLTGSLINALGRKNGGIVLSLLSVASWTIVELTSSPVLVLVARALAGISGGGMLVLAPIYISEIAEDSIRGSLASGPMLLYSSGVLVSYLLGWFLTYHLIIWSCLAISVAGLLFFVLNTESPVYYMRKRREEDARAAIAHYRGLSPTSIEVLDEVTRIKQQLSPAVELLSINGDPETKEEEAEKKKLNIEESPKPVQNMSAFKQLCTVPASRRAFIVVSAVMTMQIFMGMVPVQVYAKKVFKEADPAQSDLYTVLFALVLCCGPLTTSAVADKAGRRILLISSSILVSLCMVVLGYLLQTRVAPPWVTVLVILVYCFSFMFGAGCVPYVLLAEVFVPEVQNLASMLIVEWVWLFNFVILAVFNFMTGLIGIHGVFYFFAAMGLGNAAISHFFVPETKGLSTQQIQELFVKRKI